MPVSLNIDTDALSIVPSNLNDLIVSSDLSDLGSSWTRATLSDPLMEEIYIAIDNKLTKYSNTIYDILKNLGRIEIAREEWLALITEKMKEQE